MIIFVFGEMGAGKSWAAQRIADMCGGSFFEGDDALSPALKNKVMHAKALNQEEVQTFLEGDFVEAVRKQITPNKLLVVSQALYNKHHRLQLSLTFSDCSHAFVQVVPPSFGAHLKRLWNRPNGFWWIINTLLAKPFFDADPVAPVLTADDTLDKQIVEMGFDK